MVNPEKCYYDRNSSGRNIYSHCQDLEHDKQQITNTEMMLNIAPNGQQEKSRYKENGFTDRNDPIEFNLSKCEYKQIKIKQPKRMILKKDTDQSDENQDNTTNDYTKTYSNLAKNTKMVQSKEEQRNMESNDEN